MDGGAWQAAVHEVAKSRTQRCDVTFTFHFHTLEKEMATHSSVLALRIPEMGEPGGLLSMSRTGLDTTEVTQQQQQQTFSKYQLLLKKILAIIISDSLSYSVSAESGFFLSLFYLFYFLQIATHREIPYPTEHARTSLSSALVTTLKSLLLTGFLQNHDPKPPSCFSEFMVNQVLPLTTQTSSCSPFSTSNPVPNHMCCQ